MTRPGLAVAWSVEVRRAGGFDGPVVLAVDPDYFGIFDENAIDPEPMSSRSASNLLVWEFAPPQGDVLLIDLDARLEPGVQSSRSGSVAVIASGRTVVRVSFHTRVVPVMEMVVRATVIFFFLWLVARATGKRVLSELSAFELLLLVTVGDLVQQGVTQEDMSLTGAMLAVGTLALLTTAFSYASFRWRRIRTVIEGLPVVILRDGRLLDEAMRIERLTVEDVNEEARQQGIADLSSVRLAVLEPDGKFSFVTGEQHESPEKPRT